jgi:hypothetical protein
MATFSMKLKPFPIPETVIIEMPPGKREDGIKPLPTLPLSALDEETLNTLIQEFAEAVLAAAGK